MPDHPRRAPGIEARLRASIEGHERPIAAVVVDAQGARAAWLGAPADADYEIGSVSKALTGLLYRDAVERGDVYPGTTLGELLVPPDSPASRVRLDDLATHRSGLPRLPRTARPLRRTWSLWRQGTNPYGETLTELLDQVESVRLGRPRPRYSNLGFELLGHAVARAAGTTFRQLLAERLARPLDLAGMFVPSDIGDLRQSSLVGVDRRGRRRDPWTGEALGPAGGVRASISDMGSLLTALLNGTAPGSTALDPVSPFNGRTSIGAGWITIDVGGVPVTWHNGGTGGFRSWVGLQSREGRGAAVLAASTRPVDSLGFDLLARPG